MLYAPAYAETPEVRDAFMQHDAVRDGLARARAASVALIGVGNARDDSAVVRMGCFSVAEMRRLRDRGAVGDILGSFFDADGHAVVDGIGDRVVAIERADLEAIDCVVAVCSERGQERRDSRRASQWHSERPGHQSLHRTRRTRSGSELMTPRVLCAGILVGDLFVPPLPRLPAAGELLVTDDFLMQAGGCAANVAVALSKLGVDSRVVGKVGRDSFGDFVISTLAGHGIDVSFIGRSETMGTAKTVIVPVAGDDRRYIHTVGANAELTGHDFAPAAMSGIDVVYLGGYLVLPGLLPRAVVELFEAAHHAGARTLLDVVLPGDASASMDDLRRILPSVDFFLPNYDEARHLTGEQDPERQADRFIDAGVETVIITMGGEGLLARSAAGSWRVPSPSVDFVDGSGAGDAFAAGLIVGILEGWPVEQSLLFASEVGALACTALGCTDGIPGRELVTKRMSTH